MSNPPKTVKLDVAAWYMEKAGHIHLRIGQKGLTTVNGDPNSKRGHPHLFRKLAECLKDAGAPHPAIVEGETDEEPAIGEVPGR